MYILYIHICLNLYLYIYIYIFIYLFIYLLYKFRNKCQTQSQMYVCMHLYSRKSSYERSKHPKKIGNTLIVTFMVVDSPIYRQYLRHLSRIHTKKLTRRHQYEC